MVTDCQEVEILRISKRMELDGDVYEREVSYLSDHQVLHRFSKNGDYGVGWSYWKLWDKIDEIYDIAKVKSARGWEIELNPAYAPLLKEFSRVVRF